MVKRLLLLLVCVTLSIVAADKKESQLLAPSFEVFSYFFSMSTWDPNEDPCGLHEDGAYVLFHDEKQRDCFARACLSPEERWAKNTLAHIVLEHEAAQAQAAALYGDA